MTRDPRGSARSDVDVLTAEPRFSLREIGTMKNAVKGRVILVLTCSLLAGMLATFADETAPAEMTVAEMSAGDVVAEVGPGAFLVLLNEVRMLRLEVLEQRLDRYEASIERLEQELGRLSVEMTQVDKQYEAAQREIVEAEARLADPELADADRDYLEAIREDLDDERSGNLVEAADRLEAREAELLARLRNLRTDRQRLILTLEALRGEQS